ncbi:1087_t:CDS:2 [Funneliformis geosporum]|nr:1087_t:CDS:2 [Funneliformis geosporum]
MDGNDQNESSSSFVFYNLGNITKNQTGLTILEEDVQELIKNLNLPKNLYNLLLFEDSQNEFSPQILINSLMALSDPTPFNLNFRELRESIYDSLAKFAEIHRKTTQVVEEGLENVFKPKSNQFSQQRSLEQNEYSVRKEIIAPV